MKAGGYRNKYVGCTVMFKPEVLPAIKLADSQGKMYSYSICAEPTWLPLRDCMEIIVAPVRVLLESNPFYMLPN